MFIKSFVFIISLVCITSAMAQESTPAEQKQECEMYGQVLIQSRTVLERNMARALAVIEQQRQKIAALEAKSADKLDTK